MDSNMKIFLLLTLVALVFGGKRDKTGDQPKCQKKLDQKCDYADVRLIATKKECKKNYKQIDNKFTPVSCALACSARKKSTGIFLFGRLNGYNAGKCNGKGCRCWCMEGPCTLTGHKYYNTYRIEKKSKGELRTCKGINDGCCTLESPCAENDGDCDSDAECQGHLKCGKNNCPWGQGDDCCEMKACKGINDGCCTEQSPCAENDGDCDSDAQCQGDLKCGTDNCPWGQGDDCCEKREKRVNPDSPDLTKMEKASGACKKDAACKKKLEGEGIDMNLVEDGINAAQTGLEVLTATVSDVANDKLAKHLEKASEAAGTAVTKAVSQGGKIAQRLANLAKVAGTVLSAIGPITSVVLGFLVPSSEEKLLNELTKEVKEQFNKVNERFDETFGRLNQMQDMSNLNHLITRYHTHFEKIDSASNMLANVFKAKGKSATKYRVEEMKKYNGIVVKEYTEALGKQITGTGMALGESLIDTIVKGSKFNRKIAMKSLIRIYNYIERGAKFYFAWQRMKDGYATVKAEIERETKEWEDKLKKVLNKIKEADEKYFINHFNQDQWKKDIRSSEHMNQYAPEGKDMAEKLQEYLSNRYDWRDWLVIVYKSTAENAITKHFVEMVCDNSFKLYRSKLSNIIVTNVEPEKEPILDKIENKYLTELQHRAKKVGKSVPAYKIFGMLKEGWTLSGCQKYAVRAVFSSKQEIQLAGPQYRIKRKEFNGNDIVLMG